MTKNIYIFSGLGADERVFKLLDFSGYNITYINWIIPNHKETIEDYASRLLTQITSQDPTLIGLSFGGIMAIEVAKQIKTEKIIILSSVKTKKEIPFYFKLIGKINLHKLLHLPIFKHSNFIINYFFGAITDLQKKLLKQIILETNPIYLRWAVDKVLCWQNTIIPNNIIHIHGTKDNIFPVRFVKSDLTVKNGGHLMLLNKAEEVSKLIRQELK